MGYYLNNQTAYDLYGSEVSSEYFVDKSLFLRDLFPLLKAGNKHICITRPRRFGKSVMATMVGAFFGKGACSSSVFDSLKIAKKPENDENEYDYRKFMNQYNLIYINFIDTADNAHSYDEFISSVKEVLQEDLREGFADVRFRKNGTVTQDLTAVFEQKGEKFILVLDEWDCIFHKTYTTDDDRRSFISWLAALTKDKAYVALSYMTGVLPIAKYSSGSTLNNFQEYTMATDDLYSEYFGFTEAEVDELYSRYEKNHSNRKISREDLKEWYDGYYTPSTKRMYNPRSVVEALTRNCIRNYWTRTGTYDEISVYIKNDIDEVKKDIALMIAGEPVSANIEEFSATSMNLNTKNEIFSAMVVYGFLNYENGKVRIPNRELMDEFTKTIRDRNDLGYISRLTVESERMLLATQRGDTKTMAEILEFAHNTEIPLLDYNNETELTAIVNLVYLSARDKYFVEREDRAGKGYVDVIFYPVNPEDDGIILELKVNSTPEKALQQIKDKEYVTRFKGKLADKKLLASRVRLVGIGYSKKTKKHRCKVEVVEL